MARESSACSSATNINAVCSAVVPRKWRRRLGRDHARVRRTFSSQQGTCKSSDALMCGCSGLFRLEALDTKHFIIKYLYLAERVGFEPTIRLGVFRFSRPARSTAPSPLRSARAFYSASDQRAGSMALSEPI